MDILLGDLHEASMEVAGLGWFCGSEEMLLFFQNPIDKLAWMGREIYGEERVIAELYGIIP